MESALRSRGKGQPLQMAPAPLTCMANAPYHLRQMPEAQDQPKPDSGPQTPGLFGPT